MSTIGRVTALVGSAIVATAGLYAAPAAAQATRTWISGVGDDANPCSRTAPCKTFAGAISKTAAGGEINCIDQGAYGAVTITKSISLICVGVTAGVLHSSTNGIVINAAATDVIFIKGLDINGAPPSSPGLNGIRFLAGGSLYIDDTVIRGALAASPNGNGVLFAPSGASELFITNSTISNNGTATTGAGVLIQPTGTGSAKVVLDGVSLIDNRNFGFQVNTTGNTGAGVSVSIENSKISGGVQGVQIFTPAATTSATVLINGSVVSANTVGIIANGAAAKVRVGTSTITNNGTGVVALGGSAINSYGDNRLDGNGTNGTFTAPLAVKQ
ncbi:MAG: right-handed parallel beta-helix repeat-containing protein [Pseudomonadota bacterium]